MNCILCLKRIKSIKSHVKLFSKSSQSKNVVQIIKKHFWIEPDPKKHKLMCATCWTSLSSFHDFYTSVQKCHYMLEETVLTYPIKSAETELETTIADGVLNRRRGRPRGTNLSNQKKLKINHKIDKNQVNNLKGNVDDKSTLGANLNELEMEISEEHWSEIKIDYAAEVKEELNENETSISNNTCNNEHNNIEINSDDEKPICDLTIKDDLSILNNLGAPDPIDSEQPEIVKVQTIDDMALKDSAILILGEHNSVDEKLHENNEKTIDKPKTKGAAEPSTLRISGSKKINEFIAQNFILNCVLCGETKDSFADLKNHFRIEHHTRGYALCCGKKLLKRCVLVDHINFHLNPKHFQCTRCEKVLCDRRSLEKHNENHDHNKERIFQCNTCTKSFFKRCVFERHLLLHLPEEQKTIPCPKCEKTFATNYIMNQHLKLVHLNLYAKVCDICGKFIRGRVAMERHTLEHAGIQPTMVQCELCGISLTNKYGLARHMKVRHTEEYLKPQVCPFCSKVSPTLSAHQRHVKYMHRMQKKHACPMCEKAFRRATDLKEHMTTHTGEVLYTCPHCPKTFNSNANMYAHRKRAHPVEWAESKQSRYSIKECAAKSSTILSQALVAAPPSNSISQSTKEE